MVYIFDFFTIDLDGGRHPLETIKYRLKTRDLAHAHGQEMMHNFIFSGKRATACLIKDQTGNILGEVRAKARAEG